jgi:hypothetical protein
MPLHMTKIAYGAESVASLRDWLESHDGEARITTRYLPKRHEEMAGGSLFWIYEHAIVGRSSLLGFEQREDGRWWIRLSPELVLVHPIPRRAHQGWRYLEGSNAPPDLGGDALDSDLLPPKLVGELAKLGLV